MKLDYKKTFYVGLAFFIITIFWQTYDNIIAKIMIDKFGLNQTASGVVMALDNMLALFMLPLFGALSDRTNHKRGRRTPYIIVGTVVAAFAFMGLSLMDNIQTKRIEQTEIIGLYTEYRESDVRRLETFWDGLLVDMRAERQAKLTSGAINQATFDKWENQTESKILAILNDNAGPELDVGDLAFLNDYYQTYLSQLAWEETVKSPVNFVIFITTLLIALVAMSVFRSPAVSLMPDVTLKPLRSKANAIINLMGAAAGTTSLILLTVLGLDGKSYVHYTAAFVAVGAIMLIVLIIFLWKVKEPKLVALNQEEMKQFDLTEDEEEEETGGHLSKDKRLSLILILASVFLWFMGYNAVISKVSDYVPHVLRISSFTMPLLVANVTAIIAFIPIGIISTKIGRKKSILIGVVLLTICFGSAAFVNENTGWIMYIVFGLTGIGWATINVNSYPMVVELAKGSNVGRYTGYYYTFSMAAQILTPILSGIFMDYVFKTRLVLFPYAAIFVGLSFITMFFTKHGDAEFVERKGLLESFDVDMD
ncbi:MAG: MFS transporter [Acholeplasmataceae bacterium]|nr:MFS transporter [Acholeplasmataceae bacterium]